eukprot:354905-Chlamydomonas_euryale.AAC.3
MDGRMDGWMHEWMDGWHTMCACMPCMQTVHACMHEAHARMHARMHMFIPHLEQLQDAKHNVIYVAEARRLGLLRMVHAACDKARDAQTQ